MKNIRLVTVLVLPVLLLIHPASAGEGSFYSANNQYKGFYWFEQKAKSTHKKAQDKQRTFLTPEIAASRLEQRTKELERARSVMLEMGFNKNVKPQELYEAITKYKRLEAEMFEGSIRLAQGWEMANFLTPELADNINSPVNVPANRIKRKLETEERSKLIAQFSQQFELVLFTKENCPYCTEFKPVMKRFIDMYGFNLDVADLSSGSAKMASLTNTLNITSVPSLVAISKDGKQAFEIVRGFASISELESNIELGVKWLQQQGNWQSTLEGERTQ